MNYIIERRKLSYTGILLTILVIISYSFYSCKTIPYDPHKDTRQALIDESGSLDTAEYPQNGEALLEYLDKAKQQQNSDYDGVRVIGRLETRAGGIGCVLMLPEREKPRGTIIGFHGYLSNSLYFMPILGTLVNQGWAVIAVDLPGHGFSDGYRGHIDDFSLYGYVAEDIITWIENQTRFDLPSPLILMGHSTGGSTIIDALLNNPPLVEPDAIVLLAPLVKTVYSWAVPLTGFASLFVTSWKSRGGDDGYLGIRDIQFTWIQAVGRWWKKIKHASPHEIPVLIIQGTKDDVVSWKFNLKFLSEKFPNSQIMILEGAGHVITEGGEPSIQTLDVLVPFIDELFPDTE